MMSARFPNGVSTVSIPMDPVTNSDMLSPAAGIVGDLASGKGIPKAEQDLYANLPESKARGYKPGRYSFNVKGGRCEACQGDGILRIEMHFLPDVYIVCEACGGRRYNRETLEVKYRQASIADVLDMTVTQACDFLENIPKVRQKLGSIPRYFTYMAADPKFAKIVLDREVATLLEGEVSRLNKELIAYATSVVNDARLSITYRAETLRQLGMTNEQLFEATTVISVFAKNCAFSTALQLEPTPA